MCPCLSPVFCRAVFSPHRQSFLCVFQAATLTIKLKLQPYLEVEKVSLPRAPSLLRKLRPEAVAVQVALYTPTHTEPMPNEDF